MKILWHSAAPWSSTGYGICAQNIPTRLHDDEHEVAIQTLRELKDGSIWYHGEDLTYGLENPMKIYPGKGDLGLDAVKENYMDFNADFYFTHFDTWLGDAPNKITNFRLPYSSYVIVDHKPAKAPLIQAVRNSVDVVAMSKYAKKELKKKGVASRVIEHGVNTDIFKPIDEDSEDYPEGIKVGTERGRPKLIDPSETFIIGMVATNLGDRKNIPNQMQAFKFFLDNVDSSAIMYIHARRIRPDGYNLQQVQKEIGIPSENIIWPSDKDYHKLTRKQLNQYYNLFDIMINCSFGESWGLTITEAQAAGTPCIVTDFTSMPEQLGAEVVENNESRNVEKMDGFSIAPHGLLVEPSAPLWRENANAKQVITGPVNIFKAMEYYYENKKLIEEHGTQAREYVTNNYEWEDCIIPKFKRFFNLVEEKL